MNTMSEARLAELEKQVRRLTVERKGSRFVPVTVTTLKDTAGNTWSAVARNVGTYTFAPEDNSNLWPEAALAVVVFIYAAWATPISSSTASCRTTSTGTNILQIRAQVANIGSASQGIVPLSLGQFVAEIAGANATEALLRIVGYIY